jgi:hypothetical protein
MCYKLMYVTGRIQKTDIHLNLVKSLVQHHQTRMALSFPTVPSAPPSESEKCQFDNVNGSHLTAHSFGDESELRLSSPKLQLQLKLVHTREYPDIPSD